VANHRHLPIVMGGVVLVCGLVGTATSGIDPLAGIGYGVGTSLAYAGFLLIMRRSSARTPHVAGPLTEATASAAMVLAAMVLGERPSLAQVAGAVAVCGGVVIASRTTGKRQQDMVREPDRVPVTAPPALKS
jgi:drug/metabolite transporter (DMT)-like permease